MVSFPVFVACSLINKVAKSTFHTHASQTPVNLDLDDLSFDKLGFFFYANSNASPECLRQSFRFRHREGEYLTGGDHGERHVGAKRLRHACSKLKAGVHRAQRSTHRARWQFFLWTAGRQTTWRVLRCGPLAPFSESCRRPCGPLPDRPCPASWRAVRGGHRARDRGCGNGRLQTRSAMPDGALGGDGPMRSIFVMSRSSDVPVDICMAWRRHEQRKWLAAEAYHDCIRQIIII